MDLGGGLSALSQIPVDWIIIGCFFILVTVDAIRAGSVRAASLALSFPITAYLYQMLAQTILISTIAGQFKSNLGQAIIFLILEVIIFICVHQMLYSFDAHSSLLSGIVCGIAATVAVLSIWTSLPILQSIWHFNGSVQAVFGSSYRLFLILGSYLALAFIGS